VIHSDRVYCLLEAKRIKSGAFQTEQLAREFLAVTRHASGRQPLLLLLLPAPPPVPVSGHGRLEIADAIARWLEPVTRKAGFEVGSPPLPRIDEVVAYTTWTQVKGAVASGLREFANADRSVAGSVERLARCLISAIERHGSYA
jgi:hypothetical protein